MNFKFCDLPPANRSRLVNQRIFQINKPVVKRFKENDLKSTLSRMLKLCGHFWEQSVFLFFGLNFVHKNWGIRFLNFGFFCFTLSLSVFYLLTIILSCILHDSGILIALFPALQCSVRIIISIFFLQKQSKLVKLDQDLNLFLHRKAHRNWLIKIWPHLINSKLFHL